jgi:hypothetical protein
LTGWPAAVCRTGEWCGQAVAVRVLQRKVCLPPGATAAALLLATCLQHDNLVRCLHIQGHAAAPKVGAASMMRCQGQPCRCSDSGALRTCPCHVLKLCCNCAPAGGSPRTSRCCRCCQFVVLQWGGHPLCGHLPSWPLPLVRHCRKSVGSSLRVPPSHGGVHQPFDSSNCNGGVAAI